MHLSCPCRDHEASAGVHLVEVSVMVTIIISTATTTKAWLQIRLRVKWRVHVQQSRGMFTIDQHVLVKVVQYDHSPEFC